MIELYDLAGSNPDHRFSPYCWRVRMALAHKGLEPQTTPWRFHEKDKLPGAPANRAVPVMIDRGQVIADSSAIAFHLEHSYPNGPSLFGGPGGDAHARFILAWADTTLIPAMFPIVGPDVLAHLHPADQPYFRASREQRLGMTLEQARDLRDTRLPALRACLAPLRATLKHQAFLGGEEPSYADYAVFGSFQWARLVSPVELLTEDDPLNDWREALLDLFDGLARNAVPGDLQPPGLLRA
jgi:glutathione S-transferase